MADTFSLSSLTPPSYIQLSSHHTWNFTFVSMNLFSRFSLSNQNMYTHTHTSQHSYTSSSNTCLWPWTCKIHVLSLNPCEVFWPSGQIIWGGWGTSVCCSVRPQSLQSHPHNHLFPPLADTHYTSQDCKFPGHGHSYTRAEVLFFQHVLTSPVWNSCWAK